MVYVFLALIILASLLLGFVVLIQNPKGGGLNSAVGGFNNQLMGVKQTTDVLEKGTWIFAGLIGVLCLFSTLFFKGATGNNKGSLLQEIDTKGAPAQQAAPAATPSAPAATPKP
jgi:preprotein translocase subunit SecG